MTTHEQVLAAIDKAQARSGPVHAPTSGRVVETCVSCHDVDWPCPDAQQVIDRLTGWGVLP